MLGMLAIVLVFLIIQLANNQVIVSDTGLYLYTAKQLLQGKTLYKDLFFDNLPLFPYISAGYLLLFRGNILAFFYTSALECAGMALLLFKIILKKYNNYYYAYSGILLFLFSSYILLISRFQIGITTASLFILLSYYLLLSKKGLLAGISMAACLLTKGYFLPIAGAISIWAITYLDRKQLTRYIMGVGVGILLGILPFLVVSWREIVDYVVRFNFITRSGTGKWGAGLLFIKTDWPLLALSFFLTIFKKDFFILGVGLAFLVSFFLYKDFYYIYFGMIIPWLCLGCVGGYSLNLKLFEKPWRLIIVLSIIISLYNLYYFATRSSSIGNLPDYKKMVSDINTIKPKYLYGDMDIAPILAYSTNIPLLNNFIATDQNFYRSGILDNHKLLKQAIENNTLIITYGLDYPEEGIKEDTVTGIVDRNEFKTSCNVANTYPTDWYSINRINFSICH
jgi:hypothetical protein